MVIQLLEGDSATAFINMAMYGTTNQSAAPELAEELQRYLGFDRPWHVRYGKWMWNLLHGDLDQSINGVEFLDIAQKPVKEVIGDRLLTTMALSGFTVLMTWTLALPIGIYSVVRQHSVGDYAFTFLGFSRLAVPDFLLGLVLMYVAFAYFDQSVGGLFSAEYANEPWGLSKVLHMIRHLWIAAVVLGTSGTASLIRTMRDNLLDELGKPYVVTARSRGISPWQLIFKYPVRVAINPLIAQWGICFQPWSAGA